MMKIGICALTLPTHPIWSQFKKKQTAHFSGLSDDDHCWFGPKLCGKQQSEPAAASGTVWNQTTWWQGLCQSSIHLHHAEVSTCAHMLLIFGSDWPFVVLVIHLSAFSSLARLVFPPMDDNLLKYNYDDNQRVEPEWYMPIIPMVLVNGAEGIGTGWASKIPNYDIREIVNNIHRMLNGDEPLPMVSTGPGSP